MTSLSDGPFSSSVVLRTSPTSELLQVAAWGDGQLKITQLNGYAFESSHSMMYPYFHFFYYSIWCRLYQHRFNKICYSELSEIMRLFHDHFYVSPSTTQPNPTGVHWYKHLSRRQSDRWWLSHDKDLWRRIASRSFWVNWSISRAKSPALAPSPTTPTPLTTPAPTQPRFVELFQSHYRRQPKWFGVQRPHFVCRR